MIERQPDWLKQKLYPQGSELIAAAHDIGKISPGFQEKIYRALGTPLGIVSPVLDRGIGGHPTVSEATLKDIGPYIPEIAGRHHGTSPIQKGDPNDGNYGGINWQKQRMKTLSNLRTSLQTDWPDITSDIGFVHRKSPPCCHA